MRNFSVENKLKRILKKLYRKDKGTYDILMNKVEEIITCKDVNHYKNLKKPLQYLKRVHIRGPFVLVFRYDESKDDVAFYDFDHHDNIYK